MPKYTVGVHYEQGFTVDVTASSKEEAEKICELEFQIKKKNYKKIIFVEDKIINFIG